MMNSPTTHPSVNSGVRFYSLGEEQLAHVVATNKVVYLNPSAQVVLDLCDGSRGALAICRELSETFDVDAEALHKDVASALGCLAVEKLIRIENSLFDELSSKYGDQVTVLHLRFGDCTVRVQTPARSIVRELNERFRQLIVPAAARTQISLDIIPISGAPGEFAFLHTGDVNIDFSQFSAIGDMDHLKPAVVNPFKWTMTDCAWFHAGAVAKENSSVIVTGAPGSGKSSITAELCKRGWDYLTDEVLPISTAQLQTLPCPVTPIPRRFTKDVLPNHRLSELERDRIELPDDRICTRPTTPIAIFLPYFRPRAEARWELMDPGVAAAEVLNNCISLQLRGKQAVETVTRLLEQVNTHKLFYDDISTACNQIEQVLASIGAESQRKIRPSCADPD